MRIGLLNVDCDKYPNLALGKIGRWHRMQGDEVEFVNPLYWDYDRVYASKIFSFTPDYNRPFQCEVIKGGTGYDIHSQLSKEIDRLQPDYSLFPDLNPKTAYGFLTRGCPNKCPWCVVPQKEGNIRPYMDVEEIAIEGRKRLVLMDNNILAAGDYAKGQFEKIIRNGYRVDFNQAIDSRLLDDDFASLMAQMKWIDYIRFGCDTPAQIQTCERAIARLREKGFQGRFFLYCLLTSDFKESFGRIDYWHRKADWRIHPFAMPYRDPFGGARVRNSTQTSPDGATGKNITNPWSSGSLDRAKDSLVRHGSIPQWQKDLAQWVNKHGRYEACDFKDFSPRKNFKCSEYFKQQR